MAEINIEKKKPVWPWILLAILILGLIAWFVLDDDDDVEEVTATEMVEEDRRDSMTENASSNKEATTALAAYRKHVNSDTAKMGLDHVYTHKSLTLLTEALKQTAKQHNYNIEKDLSVVKQNADEIQKDPMSLKHADKIEVAFNNLTTAFKNFQNAKFSDLANDVKDLQDQADKLKPAEQTLEQKQIVKGYFDKAADLLNQMNKK